MADELKPCPFCGDPPCHAKHGDKFVAVICNECDYGFTDQPSEAGYHADPATQWNRRAPRFTPEERAALEYVIEDYADCLENSEPGQGEYARMERIFGTVKAMLAEPSVKS